VRVWLPFEPELLDHVPDGVDVEVFSRTDEPPPTITDVELYVPDYEFAPITVEVIEQMSRLRVVQTLTAGVDRIRPHVPDGVLLCSARGVHDASTAELAVALTLASLRGIPDFVRAAGTGRWAYDGFRPSLADRRVLLVGYGSIGAAVERRLDGFECSVTRVARRVRPGVRSIDELAGLLPEAEVVIVMVPITDETRGMVDAAFLARMRDGALLVNVARGAVVDTGALLAELSSGRLRAALDVTEPEPLPSDHPLWSAPGVLISPHVGGASTAFWPRAYRLVGEQLERYARGEPLSNQVSGTY
jgi:phosphoglycerate dehydrogenase-like enzyme